MITCQVDAFYCIPVRMYTECTQFNRRYAATTMSIDLFDLTIQITDVDGFFFLLALEVSCEGNW
jgi:predicted RNase H-like nuclease